MTEPLEPPLAPVILIPAGHQGKLTTPVGERVPVRVFEHGSDVLMLVVLLSSDTGIEPDPIEPLLLEYSSAHGLVRVHGQAVLEERDLIRFSPASAPEVLQRREFVRIDAAQDVSVTTEGEESTVKAHAVDLSGGGMLVSGLEQLELGARLRFRLDLSPGQPPIEGHAEVKRVGETGQRGVVFDEISSADRQRLIHFIFDRQRAALAMTRQRTARHRRGR
jgi:hypothetical protein